MSSRALPRNVKITGRELYSPSTEVLGSSVVSLWAPLHENRTMRKQGTEQHYFTVRGRGFDHKQWRAVTELAQGIVARAKKAGISADFKADAQCIMVTSSEEGTSPLVIWRKGEPGIPKEVTTRGRYDDLVQSILTAAKKVAPDIFEMMAPDGRDYRRVLAKEENSGAKKEDDLPEIKEIAKKNRDQKNQAFQRSVSRQQWPNPDYEPGTKKQRFVNFSTLPKKEQTKIRKRWEAEYGHRFDEAAKRMMDKLREAEKARTQAERDKDQAEEAAEAFKSKKKQNSEGKKGTTMTEDSIRKAAIRVAATTQNKDLKLALLEILRDTVDTPKEAKGKKSEKDEDEKEGRHDEGESVDVGDYLKEQGHHEDAAKWEKHEGDVGKKSSVAVVFPEIHDLAWSSVKEYTHTRPGSKVASGSTAQRVAVSDRLAKKWIQDAIKRPGRVHKYLGIPEGDDIPMSKINEAIEKVKGTGNKSLLSALQLAKRLKKMHKKNADQPAAS